MIVIDILRRNSNTQPGKTSVDSTVLVLRITPCSLRLSADSNGEEYIPRLKTSHSYARCSPLSTGRRRNTENSTETYWVACQSTQGRAHCTGSRPVTPGCRCLYPGPTHSHWTDWCHTTHIHAYRSPCARRLLGREVSSVVSTFAGLESLRLS
jgi:hypothetical protein